MTKSQALTHTNSERYVAKIPGSKSYTNRALVLAAMRPGATAVVGGLKCDDTFRLSEALSAFGGLTAVESERGFDVTRSADKVSAPAEPIHMGAAGTPARFMLGFSAAAEGATVVTGTDRLCERPMGDILDALRSIGVGVECQGSADCLPALITGGAISSRRWTISGDVSSQFTSSLLLLASQQPDGPVRVEVSGNVVSKPYVDMTLSMMNACGIRATRESDSVLVVEPGQPQNDVIVVEPDASGMSYYLAAAAVTGTEVEIQGIGSASAQGDVGLARAFERMGCSLLMTDDSIRLTGGKLVGIDIDMETMPDVVLTLAMVAARAEGTTRITNIANLRVKECDRIHATAAELQRLGVDVEEGEDFLVIHPAPDKMKPAFIQTYDDHRVAMAFAVLGLVIDGIEIEDPACVAKSFPNYWNELARFREHHGSPTT